MSKILLIHHAPTDSLRDYQSPVRTMAEEAARLAQLAEKPLPLDQPELLVTVLRVEVMTAQEFTQLESELAAQSL